MLTEDDVKIIRKLVQESVEPLRQDIQEIKKDVAELKNDITGLKKEVAELKNDMTGLKKEVATLKDDVRSIRNFIKIESTGIEHEIGYAAKRLLKARFQGFNIEPLELKRFKHPMKNEELTEFDGVFIATFPGDGTLPARKHLIIIEAKHYVTFSQINKKFEQIYRLYEIYLQEARKLSTSEAHDPRWTKQFKDHVRIYELDKIDSIYLCIGGPVWETGTVTYLRNINDEHSDPRTFQMYKSTRLTAEDQQDALRRLKGHIWYAVPKGDRYELFDEHGPVQEGGGARKLRPLTIQMKNTRLTNHIGHVYT